MDRLLFSKYHGAGNDFILLDERKRQMLDIRNSSFIAKLCDRHFGIGADGLILLRPHKKLDFSMIYFNADGVEGSFCGNGGRCIASFAHRLAMFKDECCFSARDGHHNAHIHADGTVSLELGCSEHIHQFADGYWLDTGSPHFVRFVEDVNKINVSEEGKLLRYDARFAPEGTNANFVSYKDGLLSIRTYERGVEAETLACGTGITAAALAWWLRNDHEAPLLIFQARGGKLQVFRQPEEQSPSKVWLRGPACHVFDGNWQITEGDTIRK